MKLKNYILFIALAISLLFAGSVKASSSTTTSSGNIATNSNWTSSPSSVDTLYVNHDMTFSNVDWRSSSSMVVIIGSSGSISPTGTNRSLLLPAGSKIVLDSGGEVFNNSGNNSNHEIRIGNTCVWGKKCCSGSTTITGIAQMDTLNVCSYDPLPVNLVSFAGNRQGNTITVEWITVEEIMSSHFILERSSDGINFSQIANVKSKVNSNSISEYQIQDVLPVDCVTADIIFYRLTQFDLNGNSETFNIISVSNSNSLDRIKLLKSSGSSDIVFAVKNYSGNLNIKLTTIDGRELYSLQGTGDLVKISTNDMSCGIIVLTITFEGDDYVFTEKILKIE